MNENNPIDGSGAAPLTPRQQKLIDKTHSFWTTVKRYTKRYFILVIIVLVVASISSAFASFDFFGRLSSDTDNSLFGDSGSDTDESCTVIGINLHGYLETYTPAHADNDSFFNYDTTPSEEVIWNIKTANEDEDIHAILVEVDSGGGSPVAGEEIANAIKNSEKPVIAYVRDIGTSAAYLAISSADKIFASKNSSVGGIGVTMSYLDNVKKNEKDGLKFEQLSAGKYKDYGNPDKTLTDEERERVLEDINVIYKNFIASVAENRKLPVDDVQKMADGASVMGEEAKSLGLIDEIGGVEEAEQYIFDITGIKADMCTY
jgi:signal peptide peptidase SppA